MVASLSWIYFMEHAIVTKKSTIPALGRFMSPFTGFWHNATLQDISSVPSNNPNLSQEVTVSWDDRLVPHISGANELDVFYVSGYTVASQRLWQMDMLARSALGRLAEVLGGGRLIERDKQQRRLGMAFGAENAVIGWKKDQSKYKILEAYCLGVNTWIDRLNPKDYPIEYKLMGFKPEPWSTLKIAAIVKYMAQSLCSRESDLEASNTKTLLEDSLFNFLFPSNFKNESPIIPADTKWEFDIKPVLSSNHSQSDDLNNLYKRASELPSPGLGSNNWAISGTKTKSARPILCNDPHLRLTLPSIWFESHIQTPEFNAYGVGVPGIPGILIGFNDFIAWGETNVGHDVADWYRIAWTDTTRKSYTIDGKTLQVTYRVEEIKVKNQTSILDTVTYTAWGPIVKDVLDDPHAGLAYHWIAHEIPKDFEMSVFLNLMKAKNYEDYYQALKNYSNPAQNFVFASKSGDIALTVTGKLPLKKLNQGLFVQDGSMAQNAWQGYIPYDHLPRTKNPTRGFVSSANQQSTDPSYPYYYNGDFDQFRGRTINVELESMNQITVQNMKDLQNNNRSQKAVENLPLMIRWLDTLSLQPHELKLLNELKSWDFKYEYSSYNALFFNAWFRSMYRLILDELYTSADSSYLMYPETFFTKDLLSNFPNHQILDIVSTPFKETAKEIVTASFQQAVTEVQSLSLGIDTWGEFTKPKIQHMANLPGFSRENVNIGGVADALNAVYNGSGPSWRMIVELNDSTIAHVIYPGGQSGNPGSKYYDNMIDDWASGKYQTAFFPFNKSIAAKGNTQRFLK